MMEPLVEVTMSIVRKRDGSTIQGFQKDKVVKAIKSTAGRNAFRRLPRERNIASRGGAPAGDELRSYIVCNNFIGLVCL